MIGKGKQFVTFRGAEMAMPDEMNDKLRYIPRGDVMVNTVRIDACYDHTILIGGHKIRVMETLEEIRRKIGGR